MSNAMTEQEVRDKFGDLYEEAYETIMNNDKHGLVMMALQSFAEDPEDLAMFKADIKGGVIDTGDITDTDDDDDKYKLTTLILEQFGNKSSEELAELVEGVARKLRIPAKCDHPQLYAHATVDIVVPIEHNSALEITGVLDRITAVLDRGSIPLHEVRSPIDVGENSAIQH